MQLASIIGEFDALHHSKSDEKSEPHRIVFDKLIRIVFDKLKDVASQAVTTMSTLAARADKMLTSMQAGGQIPRDELTEFLQMVAAAPKERKRQAEKEPDSEM